MNQRQTEQYKLVQFRELLITVINSPYRSIYKARNAEIVSQFIFGNLIEQVPNDKDLNEAIILWQDAFNAVKEGDSAHEDEKTQFQAERDAALIKSLASFGKVFTRNPGITIEVKKPRTEV